MRHGRAPGVEHGGDADLRTQMLRIGGDGRHRLRCRLEQEIVDDGLVGEGDVGDSRGQREDDVEIADGQEIGLARLEPKARRRALALGTVAVAAAVVGDALMTAVAAGLDMAAERSRAAGFHRRHHLPFGEAEVAGA